MHASLLHTPWLMDLGLFVIISCIGAQTIQIYRLALDITHEWPVLVHTVASHGPLWRGHFGFCMHASLLRT